MVKKGDLLKIFFIYLCLCHVVPGHPCGHNPLARFRPLAKMLGRDVNHLLDLLRDANPGLYNLLREEWRLYAECVGLVDTGYFKRSGVSAKAGDSAAQDVSRPLLAGPGTRRLTHRERRMMTSVSDNERRALELFDILLRMADTVGGYSSAASSPAAASSPSSSSASSSSSGMVGASFNRLRK